MSYKRYTRLGIFFLVVFCLTACTGQSTTTPPDDELEPSQNTDSRLIGSWLSECLTPDPESPWSEKHAFIIREDVTATHTRVSWDEPYCNGNMDQTATVFQYELPEEVDIASTAVAPINLTSDAGTILDIYQVSGNNLRFGHGFRDGLSYAGAEGGGVGSRITSLNNYIVYGKTSDSTTSEP